MMSTGITLDVTLTSPLHHGSGNAGNTALLRTEEIITQAGEPATVPVLSGNSVRHQLREAIAWHTLRTLDVPEGSLTKSQVDLLFTGGAITSTGAQVDLGMARRVQDHYPALGLLGYAAQSDIVAGTLRVGSLMLVCSENAWRLPPGQWAPHVTKRAAAYRGEMFGTRHDVASTAVDRYILDAAELIQSTQSTQMIYDVQTLKPGSRLAGQISLTPSATSEHEQVLRAALALVAHDGRIHLGAKTSVGYGQALVAGLPGDLDRALDWWTDHLRSHRDAVMELIRDLAA